MKEQKAKLSKPKIKNNSSGQTTPHQFKYPALSSMKQSKMKNSDKKTLKITSSMKNLNGNEKKAGKNL